MKGRKIPKRQKTTLEERDDIWRKKMRKDDSRLLYYKSDTSHWPSLRHKKYGRPRGTIKNSPLYKVYHGIPIRMTEYRYLVKYFKYKGLTFSYPKEKIKFVEK